MSVMYTYGTREIRTTLRTQMFFTQDFVTQNLWNWLRSHSNVYVYHIQLLLEAVKKIRPCRQTYGFVSTMGCFHSLFWHQVLRSSWCQFFSSFFISVLLPFFPPHIFSLSIWIFKILTIHLPWWLTPVILVTCKSRAAE